MSERNRIFAGLLAEVSFSMLPLIFVSVILANGEHPETIVASPEWTFGAAILFGQTVVKFISGLARYGAAAIGPVAFTIALLIVLGLAPSLLVLTLAIQAMEARKALSGWLCAAQVILFLASGALYVVLGFVGESWRGSAPPVD